MTATVQLAGAKSSKVTNSRHSHNPSTATNAVGMLPPTPAERIQCASAIWPADLQRPRLQQPLGGVAGSQRPQRLLHRLDARVVRILRLKDHHSRQFSGDLQQMCEEGSAPDWFPARIAASRGRAGRSGRGRPEAPLASVLIGGFRRGDEEAERRAPTTSRPPPSRERGSRLWNRHRDAPPAAGATARSPTPSRRAAKERSSAR